MSTVVAKRKKHFNEIASFPNFLINGFFWFYTIICILPLLLVIAVSFSDENSVLVDGYKLWPEKFSTAAYDFLLSDWVSIVRSYGTSLLVTLVGTLIALITMALYAYPISRQDFPHRKAFSFIMFFTLLFNSGLVPFYLLYTQGLHLRDNLWVLMIPMFVQPFFVLLIRTFFTHSVPAALLESAKIDGAGEWRIFAQIVLPLSLPVLATVGLFCTLNYWNDWFLSLLFINEDTLYTIQFRMYQALLDITFLSANSTAYSAILAQNPDYQLPTETVTMAMAVVGIGPIIFAYPFFQRFFIKGLTVGAIKG
ncbi:carbohydrate ABC transporter membrane protein 2 (CUT1 family) [Paenibacillus taihuensis]|uniref:Carbohydrate ABC transporter membrane protein 2 (CUT1 family) n=1 Tax=Paenibacillus taihuensis TaxID=1156355 RepID=A0A3D9R403_9BACL|nr:carbohydrate ABC transporter permease [Paenibacillus taihuensis]REE70510.1 carbohydrate ABC transporter membrane protein 2 (CUT1 family) [Paenibacillus taihuensis]